MFFVNEINFVILIRRVTKNFNLQPLNLGVAKMNRRFAIEDWKKMETKNLVEKHKMFR